MKRFLKLLIQWTKPFVRRIAEAYDIRTYKHCLAEGTHPLIIENLEYAKKNHIPKSVYFNTGSGSITVGENTSFGGDVMVITGIHYNIGDAEKRGVPLHHVANDKDIVIGSGCFIGSRAIILGKVAIGDNAIVGAGSVVVKDVPSKSIVMGVPARVVGSV